MRLFQPVDEARLEAGRFLWVFPLRVNSYTGCWFHATEKSKQTSSAEAECPYHHLDPRAKVWTSFRWTPSSVATAPLSSAFSNQSRHPIRPRWRIESGGEETGAGPSHRCGSCVGSRPGLQVALGPAGVPAAMRRHPCASRPWPRLPLREAFLHGRCSGGL